MVSWFLVWCVVCCDGVRRGDSEVVVGSSVMMDGVLVLAAMTSGVELVRLLKVSLDCDCSLYLVLA